jgi:hypothetical protein
MALPAAGCGGGAQPGSETDATQPAPGSAGGQPTKTCTSLAAGDLVHVASIRPSKQEPLANAPGNDLRCSVLFVDASGQLILELTQASGGRAALASLRRGTAADLGQATMRPLPALGPGAFVARRVLAFTRGGRLIELQTGYSSEGRLQLTAAQLTRLAAIVAART